MNEDIIKPSANRSKQSPSKPLTALKVKNHKSGFIADAHPYRGLRLRANKNGTKTWMYRYRYQVGGGLKQIKLGIYPEVDLAEAREEFSKQRKLRQQHKDPQLVAKQKKEEALRELLKQKANEYTFAIMVEQYLSERIEKDRKPKGAKEVRRLLKNDLGKLAESSLDQIEPEDIHLHILSISNRAPDVARRFRQELSRAWRYAINTGRTKFACPINTDTGGKLTQGKRERFLSVAEVKLLIPWLPNYSRMVEDILTLTLYLGLRSGEVCKLRDEWCVEEDDGWWIVIPATEMKKHHSDHRIPLTGRALIIVNRRKGRGIWFPSRIGGPVKQKVLGVEVYAHSGRSGAATYKGKLVCPIKNWAPNDLRKTARSHLAALSCPYEVAELILHHKIPGVGGLYNQYDYNPEKRKWLLKLGQYFDELSKM